jgi:hypothetical protein
MRAAVAKWSTMLVFAGLVPQLVFAATQLGPPTWGYPDMSWGARRPVTAADRAAVASYRSSRKPPTLMTNFTSPADLQAQWTLQSDDNGGIFSSCRRPESDVASSTGLQLRTLAATNCHAKWSTGGIVSKARQQYGFFEANFKIANITGMNNAFWLVTDKRWEIDIAEVHYKNDLHITIHNNNNWAPGKLNSVGFDVKFADDFSAGYHDFGVLWQPKELIFEVDGAPVAAVTTDGSDMGSADVRLSTALGQFGGDIPANPVGHDMDVRSVKVLPL